MVRGLGFLVGFLTVVFGAGTARAAPYAFIGAGQTVARIDVATNEAVSIPLVAWPFGVAVTPDGARAYTTNSDGTVSILDGVSASVLDTVDVSPDLGAIAVTNDGSRAYVAERFGGTVSVVDGITGTVTKAIDVGFQAHGAATNPAGTRVYVSAAGALGASLAVIDTATDAAIANVVISTTTIPSGVAVSPDGTRVYVTLPDSQEVVEYDAVSNLPLRTAALGCDPSCPYPQGIVVSPDGSTVYVTGNLASWVSVLDASTMSQVDTIPTPGDGWGIDVTPDGSRLYVASPGGSAVFVIDTAAREVVATLVGFDGPFAFGSFIGGPAEPAGIAGSARSCQKALAAGFVRLAGKGHKLLAACFDRVQGDLAGDGISSATVESCARALDLGDSLSKLARLRTASRAILQKKCAGVEPSALGSPCAPGASNLDATIDCVVERQIEAAGRAATHEFAGACTMLQAVGLGPAVPGICP